MSVEQFRETLPEFAKDLRLNLSSVFSQAELTPKQAWGTAVAAAYTCRNTKVTDAIEADAKNFLTTEELDASRTAASLMAMTNIYYRFGHLAGDEEFSKLPARLRMNGIRTHGVDRVDFELWCLAVSAITGCEKCVSSHWHNLREHDVSRDTVLAAVRVASVIHAAAVSAPS